MSRVTFSTISFITENGKRFISHIDEIALVSEPTHKWICEMSNQTYKKIIISEKLKYIKRLIDVNKGCSTSVYLKELKQLVTDIGIGTVQAEVDLPLIDFGNETQGKVHRMRIA